MKELQYYIPQQIAVFQGVAMFSPSRQKLSEIPEVLFPFAGKRLSSLLEGHDVKTNDEPVKVCSSFLINICLLIFFKFKVLFLGCQSPEDCLCTAASSSSRIQLHLNHASPAVVARNLIIWSIISDPDFTVQNEADSDYLWDVMYNATWPYTTKRRFIRDAKKLRGSGLCNENTRIPHSGDQAAVKHVVHQWLGMLETKPIDNFVKER